jgi:hypothetical protein
VGTYEDAAIEAVRDFLVNLLNNKEWCQAEFVGRALKILVDSKNRGIPGIPGGTDRVRQETCDAAGR